MAVSESVAGWSKTAADNNDADTAIGWSEGQTPGSVNNSARSMMAAIANFRDDQGGQLTSGGSSSAYTLTTNQGLDTAYADGNFVCFVANHANTGASTLNVDSIGAEPIRKVAFTGTTPNDVALDANDIVIDQHCLLQWDASADTAGGAWILLNPMGLAARVTTIASGSFPAAAVLDITDIPATYRELMLVALAASSNTATRKIQVQISIDNGSNFIATNYVGFADDGTNFVGSATIFATQPGNQAAAATLDFVGRITNYQGGMYPFIAYAGNNSAGAGFAGNGSYVGGTDAVNALRFLWNGSGNFDGGTYALYGIR